MTPAQFNPSTLKASFNSVTGKAQWEVPPEPGNPCDACTNDPAATMQITTSGILLCCRDSNPNSVSLIGPWDGYINTTINVDRTNPTLPTSPCKWEKIVAVPADTLYERFWVGSVVCDSGTVFDTEVNSIKWELFAGAVGVVILSARQDGSSSYFKLAQWGGSPSSFPYHCFDDITFASDGVWCGTPAPDGPYKADGRSSTCLVVEV